MRKFLPIILIVTILAGIFSPVGISFTGDYKIKKNIASAVYNYNLKITPTMGSDYINLKIEIGQNSATGDWVFMVGNHTSTNLRIRAEVLLDGERVLDDATGTLGSAQKDTTLEIRGKFLGSKIKPETNYKTKVTLVEQISNTQTSGTTSGSYTTTRETILFSKTVDTPTTKKGESAKEGEEVEVGGTSETIKEAPSSDNLPSCGLTSIEGCFIRFLYYVFFVPTSYLFALSGSFFDHTFAFSVNSSSYESEFISQGWGIMRDFCNMFFIFIMLYVALSTILNINGSKTKEMIVNVIIVGLLINFSLFFTKIIIDTSNILARVFYTSDAISVQKKDFLNASNIVNKSNNVIPLSEALVSQVDPQNLVANSSKVTNIKSKLTDRVEKEANMSAGGWIIVIILATGFNIVGFIVFLSVGLIFIVRIVGLWLAMIFSPLAFFSYAAPGLENMPKFGHKQWLPETLKMAFLAPVFIFFIYLILAFLDKGLNVAGAGQETDSTLMFVISISLPFAILMVLLFEAKKIAVKFSGEMGAAVSNFASKAGGLALGAGMGVAALGLRSTIGKRFMKEAADEDLKKQADKKGLGGFIARQKLGFYDKMSKSSFDVRNTGLAKKAESALGTQFAGKGALTKVAEGGYAGAIDRRIERGEKIEKNYNAAVDRQMKINKMKRQDPSDPTERESLELDLRAKEWNKEYQNALKLKKNEFVKNGGDITDFSEKDFRLNYISEQINNENPPVLSSEETRRQNKKDIADSIEYGSDYLKRRRLSEEYASAAGISFNEAKWRESEKIERRKDISESEAKELRELRKQIRPEKEPLSNEERGELEKKQETAKGDIQKLKTEKKKIDKNINDLGFSDNDIEIIEGSSGSQSEMVDKIEKLKEAIETAVKTKQKDIIMKQIDIDMLEKTIERKTEDLGKLGSEPSNDNIGAKIQWNNQKMEIEKTINSAKSNLMNAQMEKKESEYKIRELENLVKNKEANQREITGQRERLNEIKEKLKE